MIQFDEVEHKYTRNGVVISSVTQVIGEWRRVDISGEAWLVNTLTGGAVPASMFEGPSDFGTAVHKAIQYYIEGIIIMDALHPKIKLLLHEFMRWVQLAKVDLRHINEIGSPYICERPMYSKKYGYAGTPDIVCPVDGAVTLIDIKTGAYDMAGPQTAAYEQLYRENVKNTRLKRVVLSLPKQGGSAKVVSFTEKADWSFFKARLATTNYLRNREG